MTFNSISPLEELQAALQTSPPTPLLRKERGERIQERGERIQVWVPSPYEGEG
jgi:hypothetical protein